MKFRVPTTRSEGSNRHCRGAAFRGQSTRVGGQVAPADAEAAKGTESHLVGKPRVERLALGIMGGRKAAKIATGRPFWAKDAAAIDAADAVLVRVAVAAATTARARIRA
jgi:hypothetical protein